MENKVYKIMSGNSELERFKNKQKAIEVCKWYQKKGFPNAKIVTSVVVNDYKDFSA